MATAKSYLNGMTMGIGNARPVGGPRGIVSGWSAASVRRHKRWLYSVDSAGLTGVGFAVTLTVRDIPPSADDWQQLLRSLFWHLRDSGALRWHWVVEWQRRGAPHVHLAIYYPDGWAWGASVVVAAWLRFSAPYGARQGSQHAEPITGATGWLKYLSKHASRGVAHYQRQGMPPGWTKTGRLWGHGGSWPTPEPLAADISMPVFYRVRRMVRSWAVADARARGDLRGVAYLRGMLKCHDAPLSRVRGVSEWVPQPLMLAMLECAGWTGELAGED